MRGAADSCASLRLVPDLRPQQGMAATTRPWTRPARPTTGDQALAAAKLAVRRLLELAMGTTRWASPPPEMSIRAAVLIWLLTSIAFALFVLAW